MIFNEVLYRDNKNLLDFDNCEILSRNAVRAVIINEKKILMVFLEKTQEYKFPGGGVEENETNEEALEREVLEESGCIVSEINGKIGTIVEYGIDINDKNKIFKMTSDYYSVNIENKRFKQKLEKYEKELMFKPCWVEIRDAYKANKYLLNNKLETTPWIKRETRVLEILKEITLNF